MQCRLNFYNPEQNLLTRWFTSEYSMFFDLLLPGMQRSGVPIPLGGTSNHFHRGVLERLGAWDPYNVTEDADLGIRLHKLGLRTVVIDSTTYEEANPRVGNWIRQRSRWIKGYVHTWLVHMRHPIALWRALGWRGFWGFQFTIGGTGLTLLLNPVYWLLTTLWFGTHWGFIGELFPDPIFYLGGVALYLGNFLFVYVMVAGTLARGHHSLVRTVFLSPLYWALMSVAAWKGVLQLAYAPSYWEKTEHGWRPRDGMPSRDIGGVRWHECSVPDRRSGHAARGAPSNTARGKGGCAHRPFARARDGPRCGGRRARHLLGVSE